MIPENIFINNLELCSLYKGIMGDVVECGVWKGGMIAAISEVLGKHRNYYLFDSFEGLPPVKDIDGPDAKQWQENKSSPLFYENCKTDEAIAAEAMTRAKTERRFIVKGWFNETLPAFSTKDGIAILRLDGDWYESTMTCLEHLFHKVNKGGLIIIDDYFMWDGCTKAVHEFLVKNRLSNRIRQFNNGVCYIIK